MVRVTKKLQARRDLQAIWRYIADDSPDTANAFLGRIERGLDLLASNPKMGRSRDELAPGIRSFPVGNYVIFYQALPNREGIKVVRVLRGSQDIARALGPRGAPPDDRE